MPRPIRATISAGALAHNLTVAKRHAGGAKVWAVIKANAYGHGVERAARDQHRPPIDSPLDVLVAAQGRQVDVEIDPAPVGGHAARIDHALGDALDALWKVCPGLRDRVGALDGELHLLSPEGGPTVLMVEIPCGS